MSDAGWEKTRVVIFTFVFVAPNTECNDITNEVSPSKNKNFLLMAQRCRLAENRNSLEILSGGLLYCKAVEIRRQMEIPHTLEKNTDAGWELFRFCASEKQFPMTYCVTPHLKAAVRVEDLSGHTFS